MGQTRLGKMQYKMLKDAFSTLVEIHGKEKNHQRVLASLVEKDLIYLSGEAIKITDRGRDILRYYNERRIEIIRPQKWDGVWRIVVYDIPVEFSTERKYFREKLKEWGFVMIQKSVWAHPFECQEELAILARDHRVSPYVIILTTNKLPNQSSLKRHFKL